MVTATEIIEHLATCGVTFQVESADGLRVIGISRLNEQERETLKRHKTAILRALEPPPTGPYCHHQQRACSARYGRHRAIAEY